MSLIFDKEAVAEWVSGKIGKPFSEPYTAFGVEKKGSLTGGVVFTSYTGEAIEMSIAGSGIVSRGLFAAIYDYVFDQLKCSRLSIHTSSENKRIRKMAPAFGFVFEGTARNLFGDKDGFAYSITKRDLPAIRKRWRI